MTTLFSGGVIRTMDQGLGITDALLVDGGRVVATGEEARTLGRGVPVVDLEGRTAVPGMIDAHAHLETDAVSNAGWVDVRAVDEAEMLLRLAARAATVPRGTWIIGQATFSQDRILPLRDALDSVVPDHPVLIRASMHAITANTRALERAGLLDLRYSPVGTVIDRHPDGTPTGRLLEAFHLFPIDPWPVDALADVFEAAVRDRWSRHGVTTVYEVPMSREGMRAFQRLDREDRLRVRVALFPAVKPGLQPLVDDIGQIAALGMESGFGNDRLWFGGLKYFLDSIHDHAFDAARDVEHPSRWGAVTHLYQEVVRALSISYEAGLQLWFHAIGTGAQQLVIDAAREAQAASGSDGGTRTRIEHAFNEFPGTEEMYEGLRATGVIPIPNAVFIHIYGGGIGSFPFRSLIERGFTPPGTSDNSGTQPFANNPWFGIGKLRTRRNLAGEEVEPEERISLHDAIRTYTEFGAFVGHREGVLGVLKPGSFADLAVLDRDPFVTPDEELEQIGSVLTVVDGEVVYSR